MHNLAERPSDGRNRTVNSARSVVNASHENHPDRVMRVGRGTKESAPAAAAANGIMAANRADLGERHSLRSCHGLLLRFGGVLGLWWKDIDLELRRLVQASGRPYIRLHDLRDTHATHALQAGVAPKVVADRLGHSTVAFTMDVYAHAVPATEEAAADVVADLIANAE